MDFVNHRTSRETLTSGSTVRFLFRSEERKSLGGIRLASSKPHHFARAELEGRVEFGSSIAWVGRGTDSKSMTYVHGKVLQAESPRLLQCTFAMGQNRKMSRATIELLPESETTKVVVTHDDWAEDDPTYTLCSDGWPRIFRA